MPLDYAREAAEEAGYLRPNSTVADLLNRIADELSGRKVFTPEEEATATGIRMAQLGQDEQDRFEQARLQVGDVTDRRRLNLTDEEHNNAAMMTMQGLHPEDAVNEALGRSADDANVAFNRALDYAHGEPLPEETAAMHMVDSAARDARPDGRGGAPAGIEAQLADIHDALARADAAGLLGEPERAEMEAANGWIDQARNYAQGVLQAAACIARGMV
jgi:hypothetical protein